MESFSKESRILLAIKAFQQNKNLSIRKVAWVYNVCRQTVQNRMKGMPLKADSHNGRHLLTKSEENCFIEYILDLNNRGIPPRVTGVKDMANLLLKTRSDQQVGTHWAKRFITRREELKTRRSRAYDFQRALCEDRAAVDAWFNLVRNMKTKYGVEDGDFYNFDETGFMMGVICASMVVTRADRKGKSKFIQPGNREWATVIECVNSEGWCLPPFLIV
jgi:hypothetical protein